jgi:5'(3')-deoxyribonucleotidase
MKTIFLDMDGVVADWEARAAQLVGYSIDSDTRYPDEDWAKLQADDHFYRHLPLCPGAEQLVSTALELGHERSMPVYFLTALPHKNDMPWSIWDKTQWAMQHFPGVPVWFGPYSVDKYLRAGPGNILIDDRVSNINQWVNAGGIGIHHVGNIQKTIENLYNAVTGD